MTLKFCQECKSLMGLHEVDGKDFLKCLACDFVETVDGFSLNFNEVIKDKNTGKGIKNDKNDFATYLNTCKKCGHDKAQILDMGVFYSDEDNLILLKCGSCGFSEKIGRKTS